MKTIKTSFLSRYLVLGGALVALPLMALPSAASSRQTSVAGAGKSIVGLDHARPGLLIGLIQGELGLTAEQVRAARVVLLAHQAAVSAALDEVMVARSDLRRAIRDAASDQQTLVAAAEVAAEAQRELLVATTLLRADLYPLLTPTQAERLESLEAAVLERVEEVRQTITTWVGSV